MLLVLYALIAGAVSALGFAPVSWWPLLLIAFAVLCELLDRNTALWRSALIGWAFGLGQFIVGLNWIATSFTYQSNMPAWLGWVAVVLLSLYLAVYPAIATAVAHGRMTLTEAAPVEARAPGGNDGEEKRRLQSQLLKIHSVSHGDKAIDRWLHENWRGELLERWGPPDTGAAIRRWESRQRRRSGRQPTES